MGRKFSLNPCIVKNEAAQLSRIRREWGGMRALGGKQREKQTRFAVLAALRGHL
jgi:hypothetical protein